MGWKNLFFRDKISIPNRHSPEWWKEYYEATQSIDYSQLSKDFTFKILDTETTGFDYQNDRIISVGVIPAQNYELWPGQAFHTLVKQDFIRKDGVSIHGLTMNDIQQGRDEKEMLVDLVAELQGTVIIGHHIAFDISMINAALQRHWGVKLMNAVIDTAFLYKRCFPLKFIYDKYMNHVPSLDEVAQDFELVFHDRHSALGDAAITGIIFLKLLKILEHSNVLTVKELIR